MPDTVVGMTTVSYRARGIPVWEVPVARGFRERLFGLHSPGVNRIAFTTTSVHTFGLREPIRVVVCGDDMEVVDVRTLPPNRLMWARAASMLIELDLESEVPLVGATLELTDG